MSRYSQSENIFPNRPYWDENGVFTPARNESPICSCPSSTLPLDLCSRCQSLRLRHYIFCEVGGKSIDLGSLEAMMKRPNCTLCSLFVLGYIQTLRGARAWDRSLEASNGTSLYIDPIEMERQQKGGYILRLSGRPFLADWIYVDFEVLYQPKRVSGSIELLPEVWPRVDFGILREFYKDCIETHQTHNQAELRAIDKMFIVNVREMRIMAAPIPCKYIALSYVWGKPSHNWFTLKRDNIGLVTKKGSLKKFDLPQTVRDAMQVCLEMEESYLWVDSLCIFQDDITSLEQQVDRMDEIYAQAIVTIVAAAGDQANSGLPGVSVWERISQRQSVKIDDIVVTNVLPRLRDTVDHCVWNTRGWTFQERIFSTRCLFFTEIQVYFACPGGVQYEVKNHLLPISSTAERYINSWDRHHSGSSDFFKLFTKSVAEYSRRKLTSENDILRAFQGVMNDMKKFSQQFYFGLPGGFFEEALLWQSIGHVQNRVADVILPSWSWISAQGPVKYTFTEHRLTSTSTTPIPAYWPDGQAPNLLQINWSLSYADSGSDECYVVNPAGSTNANDADLPVQAPPSLRQIAGEKPGRLLFSAQHSFLSLKNSVPFNVYDTWWTDYTADVDLRTRSMISIMLPGSDPRSPGGYMEMDKDWASQNLDSEAEHRQWEFIAISLAASDMKDVMHMYLTLVRDNHKPGRYPLVWSRNVRNLVVNVVLIERDANVARRLGIGKVFLDVWESSNPIEKWIILE